MKTKILIIDDDKLVSKSLVRLLEKNGYEVASAGNAPDAIALAAVTDFDLVVSDVRMPGENGIVAVEKIKEIYQKKRVYAGYLLISGYAEEDTPEHAIRLGINKFLFKPFENDVFLKNIREELELVDKEKALKNPKELILNASIQKTSKPKQIDARRVVITGIGCVSPNGIGREAYWQGLKEGKNCVDKISFFDCSSFPSKAAAEIRNFSPTEFVDERNELKRMGRSSQLAIAASKLAVQDSNLSDGSLPNDLGVILGSAVSGLEYVEVDFRALERGGVRKVRPFLGIAGFAGAISSEISRSLKVHGPSITISTGCTSSTDAMGYAFKMIRDGSVDILITGGADACVTSGILSAFCQMGAVTFWENNLSRASRPFNKDRGGFVIGEGAWVFIFEELKHAQERNARIYGEVIGYGATCDAWHMAKPHPSGEFTTKAIGLALEEACCLPNEVDLFESYGNGTPVNDSYETGVVKKVFGQHAYNLLMPSIKSMLGHPLGASGSQQVAAAAMAFELGIVHPTINYEVPDPECDLNYVPNSFLERKINVAVCSSIAFGAKNSTIVLKRFSK